MIKPRELLDIFIDFILSPTTYNYTLFRYILPFYVKKKSHPYFLHNNFQNPIASKWMLSIDELTECFIRIVAVMVDVFQFSPERKLVYAPFANEGHLNYRIIHVAVI